MKLDPPFLLMIGVVGLGAFAVFRLTKTKGNAPQTTSVPDLLSQPLPGLQLQQGTKYQGRLALQPIDVPPLASSKAQLGQFLELLGFKDVAVYMNTSELPPDGTGSPTLRPWNELRTGATNNRFFEGTWSNANVVLPRPKQIDRLSANGATLISGMTG